MTFSFKSLELSFMAQGMSSFHKEGYVLA